MEPVPGPASALLSLLPYGPLVAELVVRVRMAFRKGARGGWTAWEVLKLVVFGPFALGRTQTERPASVLPVSSALWEYKTSPPSLLLISFMFVPFYSFDLS